MFLRRWYSEDDKAREMKNRADDLGIEITLQESACLVHSVYNVKTDMLDADGIVEIIDSKKLYRLLFPKG